MHYIHPIATLVVVSNTKGIKNLIVRYVVSWHPTSTGLMKYKRPHAVCTANSISGIPDMTNVFI